MDLIKRIEVAVLEAIKAESDSGSMAGSYTFKHSRFVDCDGSIPLTGIAHAALAAIRETHAIVPRKLIDAFVEVENDYHWEAACAGITAWARDHAGEVKG